MACLKGKVALITGASSGIGEGIALHLAGLGVNLSLAGRNEDRLAAVVDRCAKLGVTAIGTAGDITAEKYTDKLVAETVKKFGKLDVLVNNAGITISCGIIEGEMSAYDKIMAVNVRAPFYLTKVAAPELIKTKGTVVNMSSIAAEAQIRIMGPYSMAKAAVNQMTKCAAAELAQHGVRVNAVCPGWVETPLMANVAGSEAAFEQLKLKSAQNCPLGRVGRVSDVAKIVTFLASDASSFTTGQMVKTDGGVSLK